MKVEGDSAEWFAMAMNLEINKKVMETVWPWRRAGDRTPEIDVLELRALALRESAVMLVVGTVFLLLADNFQRFQVLRHPGMIAYCLALLVVVGGMWVPSLYRGIQWFFRFFAHVLATGMAWLLLAPFFYIFFTLGRLVRLLKGKDKLGLRFPSDEKTYWVKWDAPKDIESYKHQF